MCIGLKPAKTRWLEYVNYRSSNDLRGYGVRTAFLAFIYDRTASDDASDVLARSWIEE